MNASDWLECLERLAVRLPAYGMSADLTLLTTAELWGLYRHLVRLTGGGL